MSDKPFKTKRAARPTSGISKPKKASGSSTPLDKAEWVIIKFKPVGTSNEVEVRMPVGIHEKIKMVLPKKVAAIRDSVDSAKARMERDHAMVKAGTFANMLKIARTHFPEVRPSSLADAVLPFIPAEEACEHVLWLLQFEEYRDLRSNLISRILIDSARLSVRKNDAEFFKRLGTTLAKRPVSLARLLTHHKKLTRVRELLVTHWLSDRNTLAFCWFSDPALYDFLQISVGQNFTLNSVRKTRQRLKLRNIPIIRKVEKAIGAAGPILHLR